MYKSVIRKKVAIMFSCKPVYLVLAVLISAFLVVPVSALYDFEGLPLTVQAQGTVNGELLTFGRYGLENPPYSLQFDLPAKPQYARVYTGIWGGTEKYTGSAEITVNNMRRITYTLSGSRDVNPDVYEAGHGVYWIAYDATDVMKKGTNLVLVNTSKGVSGNKLDGRVYGVLVVAAVSEPDRGITTQYWIAEGNEDLHGEGWSGTNPTRHDETNVTFTGADLTGITSANLSTLEIAGTRGQPDYIMFNSHELGIGQNENGTTVTDIGDERSFDAEGGTGIDSRYTDAEVFNVTSLLKETNTVRFIRGMDLNGDGVITTTGDVPEGEDYIHPVSAVLAITKSGTASAPDLAVDHIRIDNAYQGETATITAEIRNYGTEPDSPVTVTFLAGTTEINSTQSVIPPSGIALVSVPWKATEGTFTITARVSTAGDTQQDNNAASQQVTVGTPPDLSVSLGSPVHKGDAAESVTTKAPLAIVPALAGLCMVFLLRRRDPGSAVSLVVLSLVLAAGVSAVIAPAGAESGVMEYVLPLHIANNGGSDAPAFTVSVYLDGEKIADKSVNDGIKAYGSATVDIPVFTTPGSHEIRVVVDEPGLVKDSNPANNIAQGRYDFPQ
ncbi:MAG: DUF3344 domain-containing protein [Methanoregula sp.]|nr:DUF3344 domain-containing protein [Methanoregula sp.]